MAPPLDWARWLPVVSKVQNVPCLYDMSDSHYMQTDYVEEAWSRMARQLQAEYPDNEEIQGWTGPKVKDLWSNIRHKYTAERRKERESNLSGAGAGGRKRIYSSGWALYTCCSFLEKHIGSRTKGDGNCEELRPSEVPENLDPRDREPPDDLYVPEPFSDEEEVLLIHEEYSAEVAAAEEVSQHELVAEEGQVHQATSHSTSVDRSLESYEDLPHASSTQSRQGRNDSLGPSENRMAFQASTSSQQTRHPASTTVQSTATATARKVLSSLPIMTEKRLQQQVRRTKKKEAHMYGSSPLETEVDRELVGMMKAATAALANKQSVPNAAACPPSTVLCQRPHADDEKFTYTRWIHQELEGLPPEERALAKSRITRIINDATTDVILKGFSSSPVIADTQYPASSSNFVASLSGMHQPVPSSTPISQATIMPSSTSRNLQGQGGKRRLYVTHVAGGKKVINVAGGKEAPIMQLQLTAPKPATSNLSPTEGSTILEEALHLAGIGDE